MKILVGDTYFNRWPVNSIPLSRMAKVDVKTHDSLFRTVVKEDFLTSDDCPHTEMMSDESALKDDQVVPFPHEHEMNLALEQQHIFNHKVFIDLSPGSGEKAKAYLTLGLWVVIVCMTGAHKAVDINDHGLMGLGPWAHGPRGPWERPLGLKAF